MKNVLLLCVTSQNVCTFRAGLIKSLQQQGCKVSVVAFDDDYKQEINELGVDFYCVNDKNRSLNPLKILALKGKYKKIIKQVKPDIVFTFMLKPNIFGALASKKTKTPKTYCMVEGAGDAFINNSLKWKVIRKVICILYKRAFKRVDRVFFLNQDDVKEFIKRKLVKENQCEKVFGVGVDLNKFESKPIKNNQNFLMVARMLKTKGVLEYCECARLVKQKYPQATFSYLGGEGSITLNDVKNFIDDGSINYLGTTKDVRPYLEDCTFLLLPSYREGMPVSVMEAQAVGRGIITFNNIGCRDTVIDGQNGLLVENKDYQAMAEKCMWVIENPVQAEQMGLNARKFAEENFDSEKINEQILSIIL